MRTTPWGEMIRENDAIAKLKLLGWAKAAKLSEFRGLRRETTSVEAATRTEVTQPRRRRLVDIGRLEGSSGIGRERQEHDVTVSSEDAGEVSR